ncbi:MAG: hypothetical protein ABSF50_23370, partial [Burkholderiaceae bacterium]
MAAPQPQVAGAGKRRAARKTRSTASTPRTTERAPIRKSASNARRLKATEFVVDEKPAREPGGTLSELLAAASNNTLALNPLLGIQPIDIASAGASLVKALALSPRKLVSHWGRLMLELNHVTRGNSALEPDARDRRFSDAAWKSNGAYRRLLQGYLATHRELNEFVNHSGIEDRDKSRAKFFVGLLMDAIAPSNWVLGNPAVVRKAFETGGQSLLSGLQNFLDDVRDNRKLPAQVDATPFRVGENVATSPGQVVLRHDLFELLQFTPTTEKVHRRPLVMSPPQVNKYYVVDLTPEKSLIKWATDSGIQLFVISWR